jgi:hypothetical protein
MTTFHLTWSNSVKKILLATAVLSIGVSSVVHARGFIYTVECAWPNGDHWSQTTNSLDAAVDMGASCKQQGGKVSNTVELAMAP